MAVAFLALAGACVASLVMGTPALSRRGEPAARAFLDAWRAGRSATFVADYDFTRTLADGAPLVQSTRIVQRPPDDRLVIGLGSAEGRLAGKVYRCASSPTGAPTCITSIDAAPYGSEVDAEVAVLERYVLGARPVYDVIEFAASPSHCFRLDLAVVLPSPPYGDHALFCFDPADHAPVLTVVERPGATDRTEARSVRTDVTDADLAVTDLGPVLGAPGPTTTSTSTTTTSTTGPAATVPAN
jgi:hypothetical protein